MFYCDCCGWCCRSLDRSNIYKDLDRGDGICKYLNNNFCSIYEQRPLLCRVDESYEVFFKDSMNQDEYYRLNYSACQILKRRK